MTAARQEWPLKRKRPAPKLSEAGGSWLLPFSLTADNGVCFVIKAGNKDFGLSGDNSSHGGGPSQALSELVLKKKYRWVCNLSLSHTHTHTHTHTHNQKLRPF